MGYRMENKMKEWKRIEEKVKCKMKYMNIILLNMILLSLMVIPISAEVQTLGVFKQGETVKLIQLCANCTYVNISSVLYPNSSECLVDEIQMTKSGTEYSYPVECSNILGDYIVNGFGDVDGITTIFAYDYKVTSTGGESFSILDNSIPITITIFGILLIILGIAVGIPWFGFIGSVMFLLSGIYTMIYGFNNVADMYTRGVAVTLIGIGLIFMFSSAYEWIWGVESGE